MRMSPWVFRCAALVLGVTTQACSGTTESTVRVTEPAPAPSRTAEPVLAPSPTPQASAAPTSATPTLASPSAAPIAEPPAAPAEPVDAGGWTVFREGPKTRIIYVSRDGEDAWPGTEAQPKASIQAGYDALRDGSADWLLLRRGDTWELSDLLTWTKTGPRSEVLGWMRFGAYGDESKPRPVINTGDKPAIVITPGFRSSRVIEHVALTDIHFVANGRLANAQGAQPGVAAIQSVAVEPQGTNVSFSRLLFENLKIEGFSSGVVTSADVQDLALRRNVFHRLFSPGGSGAHSSAIMANGRNLLIEGNVFYLCQYPGMPGVSAFSHFSHSVYLGADAQQVVVRDNFIIKTFEGVMQRAGGVYERNVSAHNALAYHLGEANGVTPTAGGVAAWVRGNLLLNNDGGMDMGNTRAAEVIDNLVVNDRQGPGNMPNITLIGRNEQMDGGRLRGVNVGVHRAAFARNHLSGDFAYSSDQQNRNHYSDLTFVENTVRVGRVTASIAGFIAQQGWAGSSIDDLGARLVSVDRKDYASTVNALALINYYRVSMGVPELSKPTAAAGAR